MLFTYQFNWSILVEQIQFYTEKTSDKLYYMIIVSNTLHNRHVTDLIGDEPLISRI